MSFWQDDVEEVCCMCAQFGVAAAPVRAAVPVCVVRGCSSPSVPLKGSQTQASSVQ